MEEFFAYPEEDELFRDELNESSDPFGLLEIEPSMPNTRKERTPPGGDVVLGKLRSSPRL